MFQLAGVAQAKTVEAAVAKRQFLGRKHQLIVGSAQLNHLLLRRLSGEIPRLRQARDPNHEGR